MGLFTNNKGEKKQAFEKRLIGMTKKGSKNTYIDKKSGEAVQRNNSDFVRGKAAGIVAGRASMRKAFAYQKAKAEGREWLSNEEYRALKNNAKPKGKKKRS